MQLGCPMPGFPSLHFPSIEVLSLASAARFGVLVQASITNVPLTGWLKQKKLIISQFRRPVITGSTGLAPPGGSEGHSVPGPSPGLW